MKLHFISMAPKVKALPEYERRRLENIKRNEEMMAKLKLQSKAFQLSIATPKRQRDEREPTEKKKPKPEVPAVLRRSLRPRREAKPIYEVPVAVVRRSRRDRREARYESSSDVDSDDETEEETDSENYETSETPRELGPLTMEEAYIGESSQQPFVDTIMNMSSNSLPEKGLLGNGESFDVQSMELKPENTARVMSEKIHYLKFFPCPTRTLIAAGNRFGEIAFWDFDCEKNEDCDGVYLYQPHEDCISGISIQPFSLSKVFSSCYGGVIRSLDVEKESFDVVYSADDTIFCLSQRPDDTESLYFGEGGGFLNVCDARVGRSSSSWLLHGERINTIDFNPENTNLIATSSSEGTACIWDLRNMSKDEPKYLKLESYERSVHSAYFSPSGKFLAVTSVDDNIGILGGVDFMETSPIYHLNRNARGVSDFRAVWGWDDSYLFIGNLKRALDVISITDKTMKTLQSPYVSAIPYRFAAHPYKVGTLAGGTSNKQIYVWT